jgi:hypothetical protein
MVALDAPIEEDDALIPSMRGLGLGAGIGEQELGWVGDLGDGD